MVTRIEILSPRTVTRVESWERWSVDTSSKMKKKWWTRRYSALGISLIVASLALGGLPAAVFPSLGVARVLCAMAGVTTLLGTWLTGVRS